MAERSGGLVTDTWAQLRTRPQFYIAASDKKPGWDVLPFPDSFPHMNSDWLRIGPEVMYWAPTATGFDVPTGMPFTLKIANWVL